eukprot:TRINITY_DN12214_c0_g1_i1.p1 TRINITY_DN12214_c0_g1~~TRINITY_DN12214_c0_g1_i1.p1  ORF type:complete len:378 (+),score=1.42 TRINITY_DN12214_c0_g1_i1:83-1135(+)
MAHVGASSVSHPLDRFDPESVLSHSDINNIWAKPLEGIATSEKPNRKRNVSRACVFCQKSHGACDGGRPCKRCADQGIPNFCVDANAKKRGRKPNTIQKTELAVLSMKPVADMIKSEDGDGFETLLDLPLEQLKDLNPTPQQWTIQEYLPVCRPIVPTLAHFFPNFDYKIDEQFLWYVNLMRPRLPEMKLRWFIEKVGQPVLPYLIPRVSKFQKNSILPKGIVDKIQGFKSLYDEDFNAVLVFEADGAILYCNESFRQMTSFTDPLPSSPGTLFRQITTECICDLVELSTPACIGYGPTNQKGIVVPFQWCTSYGSSINFMASISFWRNERGNPMFFGAHLVPVRTLTTI